MQRFGSLLQLSPHSHSMLPDGAFFRQPDGTQVNCVAGYAALGFHRLDPPTDHDMAKLLRSIRRRVLRLCDRQCDLDVAEPDDATQVLSALGQLALDPVRRAETPPPARTKQQSAFALGFSLHAAVATGAKDRKALERLLRYSSRPPFASRNLSLTPDGRVRL